MDSAFTDAWQQLTSDGSPFSWSVQDIRGIPTRTYDHAPPHMRFIWELSAGYGDRPYLQFGDETLTYTQAHDVVSSLATYLIEQGVEHGDRVAIAMRNYPEWVLSYWAIISIGAAAVGMNAWWTGPEMEYGLGDSAPKVVIADDKRLATIAPHLDDLRAANPFHLVVVRTDHDLPEDAVTWTEAVTTTNSGLPPAAIDPEDDCAIFYTSGTTGFPKGAALTHRGCVSNIMNFSFWNALTTAARPQADSLIESHEAATETTALLAVPLFHVTGCNCCMHLITGVGGKIILLYRWDPSEALEIIERERVTAFTGVPVMSRELVEHPEFADRDTSSLATLGGGGAAVQPDLVDKIEKSLTRGRPSTGYGLTEVCGVISINSSDWFVEKPTTVGPPMPTIEAKVVDDNGLEVAQGEIGELLVLGPNNVRGYLNQPEATAEAFPDGWFRTGDLATLDEDGFISIVDRAKDMVLRGGENVYCAEVEAAVFSHDDIRECAAFAVPDDRLGEVVGIAVVMKDRRSMTAEEVQAYAAMKIAKFKVPEHVWFLEDELPRNANGKFLKRALREQLLSP
jgi:long-chain acyl-CoA synthetase